MRDWKKEESDSLKKFKKTSNKIWKERKGYYLCNPKQKGHTPKKVEKRKAVEKEDRKRRTEV